MERKEFCDRVLAKVRHATPEEKTAIRAELDAHKTTLPHCWKRDTKKRR